MHLGREELRANNEELQAKGSAGRAEEVVVGAAAVGAVAVEVGTAVTVDQWVGAQ